ncbi:MAG: TldD/PmbA family protein [Candidatus Dadabacteria bacterium]|nr:MAG: TldD/PmbA family protein [Candidatus Dadabacteria bacterium]
MLRRGEINQLIPILKKDCRRALKMKVRGFPRPYYCSFLLRDIEWFNTWASSGSTYRRRSDHTRNVYCDLRVGSYRYDQTTNGGLFDNDKDLDSYNHVQLPIDDKCYDGLRIALWKLSEAKFREALSDYSTKKASSVTAPDPTEQFPSFVKVPPSKSIQYARRIYIDEDKWVRFCKNVSKWMSELKHIIGNWVEFDASQETKVFVNTEGSVIVQHKRIFMLSATLRRVTKGGNNIEQEVVFNCGSLDELPNMRQFKEAILERYERINKLANAKKLHAYSGPVLLYPQAAGVFVHEALGHRLEGNRLLYTAEAHTFKDSLGKRIINANLTIRDNPLLKQFNGKTCLGSYDYDDEGTPAVDTVLVENGVLKNFLSSRAAFLERGFKPNGHARNRKHQRPISRMAVFIVEGEQACSIDKLRKMLIAEIKRQKKPYGLIVYETGGGETETASYDFQAFSGDVTYATLLHPDGRETPVRGVNFIGTPLQAVDNIIAVGDTPELENGYCGAESGVIPISTIAPAILVRNIELQAKQEELVTPYILPRPKL